MSTISGLQSPNPYAPSVSGGRTSTLRTRESALVAAAPAQHAAYSPDWMQAEHAATPSETVTLYGARGQLQKPSSPAAMPHEPAKLQEAVKDPVTISANYTM